MFGQWAFPEAFELFANIRTLSVGVMNRPGAKQSHRYWGKDFPQFQRVAGIVYDKCMEMVAQSWEEASAEERESLQQCLVVALQVLLPPMRGKPFYTLSLVDDNKNSV